MDEHELEAEMEEEEIEEGDPEEESAEEDDDEQQEPADELASEEPYTEDEPAQVYLPQGEGPAAAKAREVIDPEVFPLVQAMVAEQVNRAMQNFGVTQASYTAAAAQHPEVFRKYGGKIQMALAMFPEHERHTRKSVDLAITLATIEDKAGKPEFARELLKIATQLNGSKAAPNPPKAPIPAASRPPTPSSGVRSQALPPREQRIKDLMKEQGLDREEAEGMLYELSRKPTGMRSR